MASKAAIIIPILGLGIGITALILATREAKAAPPEIPEIPSAEILTVDEIMAAGSYAELNAYYNLIGELFIIGKITYDEYRILYDAYYERFYELIGGKP